MRVVTAALVALTVATVTVSGHSLGAVRSLLAPEAPAELILHESLFQKITKALLPVIIDTARKVSIPGTSSKHFSFGTITLSEFNIAAFDIGFAAPDKVVVSLKDLSMAIPHIEFEIKDKWHFIHVHCHGQFWASVEDTNIALEVGLGRSPAGGMAVTGVTDSVSFGRLSVGHRFSHESCRIAGRVIGALIGNVNAKIEELVRSKIGPVIAKAAYAGLAKAVAKLPVQLISAPVATASSITFSANLLSLLRHPAAAAASAPAVSGAAALTAARAAGAALPARDVAVGITAASADVVLGYASALGYLNHTAHTHYTTAALAPLLPAAAALCPGCKLQLPWRLNSPRMTFRGAATFAVEDARVAIEAVAPNGTVVPIVALRGNVTGFAANFTATGAERNVLHFALGVPTLHFTFTQSAVGPIPAGIVNKVADFAVQGIVVPSINAVLAATGIPAPAVGGLVPQDVSVQFAAGFAYFGLNLGL